MSNTIVPSAVHMAGLRWGRNETYIDTEKKTSFIKITIKTSLTAYNQVSNMTVTSLLTFKKKLDFAIFKTIHKNCQRMNTTESNQKERGKDSTYF